MNTSKCYALRGKFNRKIETKLRRARQLIATTDKPLQVERLGKLIDFYKSEKIKKQTVNTYHPLWTCL